jgi:hypothetical protein
VSNIVYGDELYNKEVKEEYLDSLKKGSRKILERVFKISYAIEMELDRDLYTFSRDELRRLFYLFLASTPNASKYNVNYVYGYLQWCLDNNYKKGLNPLETVDTAWKEQFVIRQEKRFYTDAEMKEMISELKNAQDAVIFYGIFLGIRGEKCSEITNLFRKDIDEENQTLLLTDADGSTRTIKVDSECIRLCRQALKEDVYIKKNGNPSADIKSETSELIDTNRVVKLSNTRVVNDGADENIVYRRFAMIAREFDLGSVTPTAVFQSGMIKLAKDLYVDGKLDSEGYKVIAKQFNISDAVLQRLKNDFLNEEGIKETYQLN